MAVRMWTVRSDRPDDAAIAEAAAIVRGGGLVVFPTETVYGLAADRGNPQAIDRLNRVKGRPPEKPYSIHVSSVAQLQEYVDQVPEAARRLIDRFWPGPLTIVMPTREGWIGFRLPDHPVALAFLAACATRIVAPSANRAGEPPPTVAVAAERSLRGDIDGVLDAGPTPLGRESTVVRVDAAGVAILREGAVPTDAINRCVMGKMH